VYIVLAYNNVTLFSDVAVVFLDKSIDTKVVTPAKINGNANIPVDGQSVTAIGLGNVDNYLTSPKDLLEVSVSIIDGSVCEKRYILNEFYDLYQICAGGTKGVCSGDSGGPLFLKGVDASKDVVVGIASFVSPAGCGKYPDAYARASMYGNWVQARVYDYNHGIAKTMCK
jgi:secreted trypsin-like serine protease